MIKSFQREVFRMPIFDDDGCTFVANFIVTTPIYQRGKIKFSLPEDQSGLLRILKNLYERQVGEI